MSSPRPYSIKTRIKTQISGEEGDLLTLLRDHIPLKQGLRRRHSAITKMLNPRPRPYSIKTRIKTLKCGVKTTRFGGSETIFHKTRIKTARRCSSPRKHQSRGHIPLQQG